MTAVMSAKAGDFGEAMWPHQIAVGISGGASILTQGLRLIMELHPDWVAIKIDISNAFNEVKRHAVIQALADEPTLRDLVPLFHALILKPPLSLTETTDLRCETLCEARKA